MFFGVLVIGALQIISSKGTLYSSEFAVPETTVITFLIFSINGTPYISIASLNVAGIASSLSKSFNILIIFHAFSSFFTFTPYNSTPL